VCDGLPPFSACLQMVARDGRLAARQVYHDEERQCNLYNTVAVLDGCVYGFGNAALQCTRLDDGALLWEHADPDWTGGPQLIVADGLIFALGTFQLVLAEATPSGYRERGRVRHGVELGYPQQPTLANGRLYLRGNRDVVCYDALHPAD
jgi:outer membrane protein assembly factor BamB